MDSLASPSTLYPLTNAGTRDISPFLGSMHAWRLDCLKLPENPYETCLAVKLGMLKSLMKKRFPQRSTPATQTKPYGCPMQKSPNNGCTTSRTQKFQTALPHHLPSASGFQAIESLGKRKRISKAEFPISSSGRMARSSAEFRKSLQIALGVLFSKGFNTATLHCNPWPKWSSSIRMRGTPNSTKSSPSTRWA